VPYHKMEDYNQRLWNDAVSEDEDGDDDVSLFSHRHDYYIANASL